MSAIARARPLAIGAVAVALLVAVLVPAEGVDAAKRKNGIIFEITTSQGIDGRITYLKSYEGEGRNFAQLEVEVLRTCVGDVDSYTERVPVILQGHTRGSSFSPVFTQNTATDQFEQTASVRFAPGGRKGGLPRWKRASGTVRAFRAIHDAFLNVECESGPVSFRTTSSRRARFGPRPPIIVVIP
ncbi:MAG: hypothetical protein ACRDK0_04385 [Solirubrobacteraceae bacterium]